MGALEGSSNTNPRKKVGRPRNDSNLIVTLDPNKLAEKKQRRLHLSNLPILALRISLRKHSSPDFPHLIEYDPIHSTDSPKSQPFPPDTRAFLYYSISPEKPRIAGELRFRVASSDDLASFKSGSDLLLTNGQPWSLPLYSLSKYYPLLYKKLREERLVPDDLDTALSTLPARKVRYRRIHFLYTLNDTFIVDFSSHGPNLVAITEQVIERIRIVNVFSDHRTKRVYKYSPRPYIGSALARFERSTLPDHKCSRTVVLRFLKIITPVKCTIPFYDDYIYCPKEGELHRRITPGLDPDYWSLNIDTQSKCRTGGLQLLWDA